MKLFRKLFSLFFKSKRRSRISIPNHANFLSGEILEARVVSVIDGDGVIVSYNGKLIEIRLFAIDCPEHGQEWGDIAKYGLIKLIGGKSIFLEMHGIDFHQRSLATLYVKRNSKLINVNEQMVLRGHAWVYRKYYHTLSESRKNRLDWLTERARSRKAGLWRSQNPIPPWEWRRNAS